VFRGGWTAGAAQAVTGIKDVGEPLSLLTERSLILADPNEETGEVRYRMLESLREFAQEQVRAMGQETFAALCDRRERYFAELSQGANEMVESGCGMRSAVALLGPERDNLRAVFARLGEQVQAAQSESVSVGGTGGVDFVSVVPAAIRAMLQSHWLWPVNELRQYLSRAAEAAALLPGDVGNRLRASVFSQQGLYAFHAGDYAAAERHLRAALNLWEVIGDRKPLFTAKSRLAMLRNRTGNPEAAVALWTECLQFARDTADPRREAALLTNLANAGRNLSENRAHIERAVALYRTHAPGSYVLSCSLNSMGAIAFEQRDWGTAQTCLEEAHSLALGDGAQGMLGLVKAGLAELFTETGEQLERAKALLEEAQTIFEAKEEWLRVAQIYLLRFHLALKIGDADKAAALANGYLRVNREARLMDADALASAGADLISRLQDAGYGEHAAQAGEAGEAGEAPLARTGAG
jgi:tetratricopeptide (TPR) repeat protein